MVLGLRIFASYNQLSMHIKYIYPIILQLGIWEINAQEIDVDSIFMNDDSASNYYSAFDQEVYVNLPDWDSVWIYKELDWIDLTISSYAAQGDGKSNPCLLFFHGGNWEHRNINQHKRYAYYFALRGFYTASIMYSVFADSPSVTPYDQISDVKSAIQYVRANADKLGINGSQIYCVGMSAGGHLIASSAYSAESEIQEESNAISFLPNALILQNPAIDLSDDGWNPAQDALPGHFILNEEWQKLSPLNNLNSHCLDIPSIVLSGTADEITPYGSMVQWDSSCKNRNCFNELYKFKDRIHGFANYPEKNSGPDHRDFVYSIYLMENFLERLANNMVFLTATDYHSHKETDQKTSIYPNPTSGILNIDDNRNIRTVGIYSVSGKLELSLACGDGCKKIEIDEVSEGLKLIRIVFRSGEVEEQKIHIQ